MIQTLLEKIPYRIAVGVKGKMAYYKELHITKSRKWYECAYVCCTRPYVHAEKYLLSQSMKSLEDALNKLLNRLAKETTYASWLKESLYEDIPYLEVDKYEHWGID